MKWKSNLKSILITLLLFSLVFNIFVSTVQNSNLGSYYGGHIRLNMNKIDSYQEFKDVAEHEYAHFLWDKHMTDQEKGQWKSIVVKDGFESGYPNIERNWHKYNEEFAECRELMIVPFDDYPCSMEKFNFIYGLWRNYTGFSP